MTRTNVYNSASGVLHIRLLDPDETEARGAPAASPFGGFTLAYRVDPATNSLRAALAICAIDDTFDRKLGLQIAVGRLECTRPIANYVETFTLAELEDKYPHLYSGQPPVYVDRVDGVPYLDKSYPLAKMLAAEILGYFAEQYLGDEFITEVEAAGYRASLFQTDKKFFLGFSPAKD